MTIENPEETLNEILRIVEGLAGNVQEEVVFEYIHDQILSWDDHDKALMIGTMVIELCSTREALTATMSTLAKVIAARDGIDLSEESDTEEDK